MNPLFALSLLKKIKAVHFHDRWTRDELLRHQDYSLRKLRGWAYEHSPFYRSFHRGLEDAPFSELPTLSKAKMMENYDELVCDPRVKVEALWRHILNPPEKDSLYLGEYRVCSTSGSTGNPGIFLYDREAWLTALASFERIQWWAGVKINLFRQMRRAFVASTTRWHLSSQLSVSASSRLAPSLRIPSSDPMDVIVEKLNKFNPHMLAGYSSMLALLAGEALSGRLKIKPEIVITSAEILTADMRTRIREAWGVEVYNQYASTEGAALASECSHHKGFHLAEDLMLIENVDENNKPVEKGAFGKKVLLSVFFNKIQPLIRYELNDSICIDPKPCPCGRPYALMKDLQGRTEDFLYFGSDDEKIEVNPDEIHKIMDFCPVKAWQVVKEGFSLTVLVVQPWKEFSEDKLRQDYLKLFEKLKIKATFSIQKVESIPQSKSGKTPLIKQIE